MSGATSTAKRITGLLRRRCETGKPLLESALSTVAHQYSSFYEPGREIQEIIGRALSPKAMQPLAAALGEVGASWTDEQRDAFLLIAGYTGHRAFSIDFQSGRFTDANRTGASRTQAAMNLLF